MNSLLADTFLAALDRGVGWLQHATRIFVGVGDQAIMLIWEGAD